MGCRRKRVWAGGLGALEHQEKRFYSCFILFYFWGGELVNMFVLHWSSPCWSKLNAEVSLFYFLPFHNPSFFSFSFSFG